MLPDPSLDSLVPEPSAFSAAVDDPDSVELVASVDPLDAGFSPSLQPATRKNDAARRATIVMRERNLFIKIVLKSNVEK